MEARDSILKNFSSANFSFLFHSGPMLGSMLKFFRSILPPCILLPTGMLHGFTAQKNVYSNHIVAYVEDGIITKQQIEIATFISKRTKRNPSDLEAENELRKKVLNALIEKKMIAKEFERMKGKLPESLIQKKYDEIQKTRFGDDPLQFTEALRRQGKTKTSYKVGLREDAIMGYMYERNVHRPNSVSPIDIQNYYQAHRSEFIQGKQFDIDQIVIKKEDMDALSLVQECLKSEYSYEICCQRLSQITGASLNRMENISENDVLPVIAEKIATLPIGSFAHEFIEFDERVVFLGLRNVKEAHTLSLNEARETIERILLNERHQWLCQKWLDQLKQKAYCVIL
jgi:hypothetical protein